MTTILWPCDRNRVIISSSWQDHLNRPGYNRAYAGVDLAGHEQPLRPSQYNGKVLQSMWSTAGYGYTIFIEYAGLLRTRVAHLKNLAVKVGDIVQPSTYLGTMDSTGNSTGTHVHWEVWLKYATGWQNIDPLNSTFNIDVTNNPDDLIPLDELEPPDMFTPPVKPTYPKVVTTSAIYSYINLRTAPYLSATRIGKVLPGETWDYIDYHRDVLGNYWYAVRRENKLGWAAAVYNNELWLHEITV